MADEPKTKKEEQLNSIRKKSKVKDSKDRQEYVKQLATRSLLERDYEEDTMTVSFDSSNETRRAIKARKPNQEEFISILTLSVEAAKYEGKLDADSLERMKEIYSGLHTMAANLSLNKDLNEEFWSKHVSFGTLQNFITELIVKFQTGSVVEESEIKSFR